MKNRKFIILLIIPAIIFSVVSLSGKDTGIVLDEEFFTEFNKKSLIQRDEFLESLMNRIVIGRGIITSVSEKTRYKKHYRIVIESSDSVKYGQKFIFFLFLDNKNTVDLLSVDSKFEFKGQLMGITPLATKRNEYILDVIMMDGSAVIE